MCASLSRLLSLAMLYLDFQPEEGSRIHLVWPQFVYGISFFHKHNFVLVWPQKVEEDLTLFLCEKEV